MTDTAPRYSFDPLERRGVALGLRAEQVGVAVGGVLGAWISARSLPAPVGPAAAAVIAIVAAGATVWSRDGFAAPGWALIAWRWWLIHLRGPALSPLPHQGRSVTRVRSDDPEDGSASTPSTSPVARRVVPRRTRRTPPWGGIQIVEVLPFPGETPMGLVVDASARSWSAVVPVSGGPYLLLDPSDQAHRLDLWRVTLNALARPGTSVRRIQWIERSYPASPVPLWDNTPVPSARSDRCSEARDSYRQLVSGTGVAGHEHAAWLVLTVAAPAHVKATSLSAATETLRRDTRLLMGQLRAADLHTEGPLNANGIARMVAVAHAAEPSERQPASANVWWPLADEDHWAAYRTDGTWHASYWIAEWPRIEVGPEFMSPLLTTTCRRTVSLTMAPVPADRAVREARSARTADIADEHLRSRAGFLSSARRDREASGAVRREAELADGHAEYRFTGFVTVTARTRVELDAACAETEQAALASHLEIRRLYGRQRAAFTWTLPFGRGLRRAR
jgi:hypothetical protein